jgi:hypothetical protein
VTIIRNEGQAPRAKLADAELHFTGSEFDGLKLIGFAVAVSRSVNGHLSLVLRLSTTLQLTFGSHFPASPLRAIVDGPPD